MAATKICNICLIEKEYSQYHKASGMKDGYYNQCKCCRDKKRKDRFNDWSSKIKEYQLKNKDKIKRYQSKYHKDKRLGIFDYSNRVNMTNDEYREYKRIYYLNRKKNDSLYRLKCNIKILIIQSFKNKGFKKNTKTFNILGIEYQDFKNHLESKFQPWMTWDNYGKYNGELNYGWDIDHIIPLSSGRTEDDIIKLNHYTNLQPLCSKINRDVKKDKLNYI